MEDRFFDEQKLDCLKCGHIWILSSDKPITNKQHLEWIREVLREHNKIHRKK